MKIKKGKSYWLAGLLAVCLAGGAFAYWTQEILVHNEFKTARYDTDIEEEFVPPDNWKPGEEINKDVWISNKGTVPAFVKAVLHQEWIRTGSIADSDGKIVPPPEGGSFPLSFQAEEGNAYAAQIRWGDVVLLASGKKNDIDLGLNVVDRIEDARGKWLLANDVPDQNGDFLLYYIGIVEKDHNTPLIVDSVTMNPLIQPAIISKTTFYDKAVGEWKTVGVRNGTYDYECAKYTMLVNATTVQATADAVRTVFAADNDSPEIVKYLADHAVQPADL